MSKHWRENITFHGVDLFTRSSPGIFQLCLWPLIAPGYLGGGLSCLSSALWCQYPSDDCLWNFILRIFQKLFSLSVIARDYRILERLINCICSTSFITSPADPSQTLGIKLPFLVMIIKNLKKYFTFEVQVGRDITRHTERMRINAIVRTDFYVINRPIWYFISLTLPADAAAFVFLPRDAMRMRSTSRRPMSVSFVYCVETVEDIFSGFFDLKALSF